MWKHEILETLTVLQPTITNPEKFILVPEKNIFKQGIRQSTQFYFGKLSQFFNTDMSGYWSVNKMLPPPCDNTLLCWEAEKREEPGYIKVAAHYLKHENGLMIFPLAYNEVSRTWAIFSAKAVYLDGKWQISYMGQGSNEYLREEVTRELVVSMKLLEILYARNVITKTVTPPVALNKKRVKHHHEPYDEYRILEVVKGVAKNKNQGEVPWDYRPPTERALHLCRGHFKTYTEDAKLFGRYTGTFWWQPSIRGNEKNGVVRKDYAVSMTQEEHDA